MTFRRSLLRAWRASAFAVLAGAALFVALCEARLRAFAVAHLLVAATTCGAALFLGRLWYASWPRASVDDEGDTNAAANGYDAKVVAFLMLGMYPLLFELCSFLTGCNDRGNAAPAWLPLFLVLMLFYILSALVSVDVFARAAATGRVYFRRNRAAVARRRARGGAKAENAARRGRVDCTGRRSIFAAARDATGGARRQE